MSNGLVIMVQDPHQRASKAHLEEETNDSNDIINKLSFDMCPPCDIYARKNETKPTLHRSTRVDINLRHAIICCLHLCYLYGQKAKSKLLKGC